MKNLKLYMALLECKPEGRNTEQQDLFFGIGKISNPEDAIEDELHLGYLKIDKL